MTNKPMKSIEAVLGWFEGVETVKPGQWKAVCPICGKHSRDKHLYIGIGTKNPNAVCIDCKHYCDQGEILATVGKSMKDLFLDVATVQNPVKPVATTKEQEAVKLPVKVGKRQHVYTDADGNNRHMKEIRVNPDGKKDVWWLHWDANTGKWVNGEGDTKHGLYNAFDLHNTWDKKVIFICEGEKDCETLATKYLTTTTTAGGCGDWHERHTKELLSVISADTRVIILCDNDEPGKKMGADIMAALRDHVKSIATVATTDYWKDAPAKADVSDYIELSTSGLNAEDAKAECKRILDEVIKAYERNLNANAPEEVKPLAVMSADQFTDTRFEFLWYPYIPLNEYTVIMAASGVGKSYLVCGIMANLTRGISFPVHDDDLPDRVEPCNVMFISSEDTGSILKDRLRKSGADLSKVLILDKNNSIGLDLKRDFEQIKVTLLHNEVRLLVVDPWQAFIGESVDLNRMNMVRPVMQMISHLAEVCHCAIILISHVNKRAQGEDANFAASGSGELVNACRSAIKVTLDDSGLDKDLRYMVHTKSSYARMGDTVKYRISDTGLTWEGFSDITKDDLEKAARSRKTVGELKHDQMRGKLNEITDKAHNNSLMHAVLQLTKDADRINNIRIGISYKEVTDRFSESIFSGKQPAKALQAIAPELYENGYAIRFKTDTGKSKQKVLYKGKNECGFILYRIPAEQVTDTEEE